MQGIYDRIVVAVPPAADVDAARAALDGWPTTRVVTYAERFGGRYWCVAGAVESGADHVHYADFDTLVHWAETRPDEWRRIVTTIASTDCLIVGRSRRAFETRPRAIQDTERIINTVFSRALGQPVDLGLGCRGYSRRAAEVALRNSGREDWPDAKWVVLIQRAGWPIRYVEADGVDWETPYHDDPDADADARRRLAGEHDSTPGEWMSRVRTAREIIEQGLAALDQPLA